MKEKDEKILWLTEKEANYLQVVLIEYRDIQKIFVNKQDIEYAGLRNKLTNISRAFEGKEELL